MSENVPERRTPSPSWAPPPPPAAHGAHDAPAADGPDPAPRAPALEQASTGTHYGPVPRYARPTAEPRQPDRARATAHPPQAGPPAPGPWPPASIPGAQPAAWASVGRPPAAWASVGRPPAAWAPVGPPPAGWGPPPPPWGAGGPWSPPRRDDYASWARRVAGAAIDAAPAWVASAVLYAGYLPMYLGLLRGDFAVQPRYGLVLVGTVLYLAAFGWAIYNSYFLAGRTGQSVGKRVMKTWLVSQTTGRPIGPMNAFLRALLHILDGLGYVGYLWPLWDDERQTLADKIAQTVVVRTPVPPLTELERRRA